MVSFYNHLRYAVNQLSPTMMSLGLTYTLMKGCMNGAIIQKFRLTNESQSMAQYK